MPALNKNSNLLARVNFPLYCVQMLSSRHVLVAGGGGSSKTGVANGFEIFELILDEKKFAFKEVHRHETGGKVVMNCATYSTPNRIYLVAGQDASCQLYSVKWEIINDNITTFISDDNNDEQSELRLRKRNLKKGKYFEKSSLTGEETQKFLKFVIQHADYVQTDFSDDEPFQRVVRISCHGNLVITGGTDGFIRVWKFPSFQKLMDIAAHDKEIDDLDFSISEKEFVSISKDDTAILWNVVDGTKIRNLHWDRQKTGEFSYKRCRFGRIENKTNKSRLFTTTNPVGKSGVLSYLQLWNPDNGNIIKHVSCNEPLSALSVRNDGKFVAVGTMFTGSVIIYIAFSLQKVLVVPEAHSMFVTGLEFIPVTDTLEDCITTLSEVSVLSISVDNKICMHSVPYKHGIPLWLMVFLLILSIFGSFTFCSYLGL